MSGLAGHSWTGRVQVCHSDQDQERIISIATSSLRQWRGISALSYWLRVTRDRNTCAMWPARLPLSAYTCCATPSKYSSLPTWHWYKLPSDELRLTCKLSEGDGAAVSSQKKVACEDDCSWLSLIRMGYMESCDWSEESITMALPFRSSKIRSSRWFCSFSLSHFLCMLLLCIQPFKERITYRKNSFSFLTLLASHLPSQSI